ncbi:Cyclophilin-like peptidyl-prolyl cis-trans isomerase family protein [Euphorbia peplus]|nr:Cyclophilin-like peptidyl-prolyl cis-trans isomerase family protein [Euphorbia peplus]
MLQNPKILQTSSCIKLPSPKLPRTRSILPTQIPKCSNFSRRELAILSNSSLLLLLSSNAVEPLNPIARAEESLPDTATNVQQEENIITSSPNCSNTYATKRAFLDISIDGQPIGRIVIGLYGDAAPVAAARFSNLVSGAAGVSYRRKDFIKILPNYVQHGGVRSFGVDAELAQKTGSNLAVERLVTEWERENNCAGIKNLAGTVSLIVRDPLKPPPKMKLIARGGKLEIDEEQVGTDPNGTEFVIATKDSPELDASNLVIGRVLEGIEVAERINQVKTVQENTSSPYFRVAKLIGDKRAVVAERGFNRPYSKVTVTNCGLMG